MRYLGNKTKLLYKIEEFIKEREIEAESFFDIFSGTGSVAEFFKNKYKTSSNDYMLFSYHLQSSKLLNNKIPKFAKLNRYLKMDVFDYINNLEFNSKNNEGYISKNYSHNSSERMYFSEENGYFIDTIRLLIEEWSKKKLIGKEEKYYLLHCFFVAISKVSNTTGTYGAYLKKWDNRALKKIQLKKQIIRPGLGVATYNEDSEELIKKIEGDLLYIDPPYTNFNYSRGYHVLETIARYDDPKIRGITGVREKNKNSNFSRKTLALKSLENLIRRANFKDVIISYSNHGIIPEEELLNMLTKYSIGKPFIKYISYRKYKTINSPNKESLKEFLIHFKKDFKKVKSPLNYEGNKFKILQQIQNEMPKNFRNFFDVFGGSGTVSLNILGAKKIIYNDINSNIFEIIKYLFKNNCSTIETKINDLIERYGLSKGNKESFYKFRNFVNSNKKTENLLTLTYYSFQNMLRQNSNGEINIPSGLSTFNKNSKQNLKDLQIRKQNLNIIFENLSFESLINKYLNDCNEEDIFYFDPPYFITTASYNDGKRGFEGWTLKHEIKLLEYLTKLNELSIKFILSNVMNHNGETNYLLIKFVQTNNFSVVELNDKGRKEVIIKNF